MITITFYLITNFYLFAILHNLLHFQTPALETADGQTISDGNAISFYLANDQLRGKDALTQAQILQWLSFADNELLPPVVQLTFPALKIMQLSGEELKVSLTHIF